MDDLVERLRRRVKKSEGTRKPSPRELEAADAIEALRAELRETQEELARVRKLGEGLAEALKAIFNKLDRDENAPNHGHQMPGIWDDDSSNGPRAGKPCDWCSQWRTFRAALAAWEGRE